MMPDRRSIELAATIRELRGAAKTVLVAIDGLGGSGKSYLAASLANEMQPHRDGPVSIVHGDDFFLPSACRSSGTVAEKPIGGDFDWRRLRKQVLDPLRRDRDARYQVYDWDRDALTAWRTIPHGAIVVVEGVYTLRPELRALYDLHIWVECPRHIRLARGIARDGERARARWEEDWMPSEDRYVAECEPAASADMIFDGAPTESH
jgi:uridine kinase